ncbi:MAG: ATP-binding protein [Anaerolineae bacterium]|nr:ATP-binding protein [Anaerolineae bacterium]
MSNPHLIVIAGPPACGKTTRARLLASALRLPLLCKDTIKEVLFEQLGTPDRAGSQRLGYACVIILYALARDILGAGASVILESVFTHPDTPGELQSLIDQTGARLTVVYCFASPEVLCRRFNARALSDRHLGHQDPATQTAQGIVDGGWLYRPDYPGQVIEVDTSGDEAVSIEDILAQLGP